MFGWLNRQIQHFVDWYKNNHWLAFCAIVLAIFGGGIGVGIKIEGTRSRQALQSVSGSRIVTASPDQPMIGTDGASSSSPVEEKVSERAEAAFRFAWKYDVLSDADKDAFQKKHQGEMIDWDLSVQPGVAVSEGKFIAAAVPLLEIPSSKYRPMYMVEAADAQSEVVLSKLKYGAVIRVRAPLDYQHGQPHLCGHVELVKQGEALP